MNLFINCKQLFIVRFSIANIYDMVSACYPFFAVFVIFLLVLQALSAANLSLVMFICDAVQPSHIFDQTPCPLQQPVLLSLIQQLSADLASNTELKRR